MKFICRQEELFNALSIVSKALPSKINIPILAGIKMSVVGDTITLSATSIDLFIETTLKARILLEGEVVVDGKSFRDLVGAVSDYEEIEIECYDSNLNIIYGENKLNLKTLDLDAFPSLQENESISNIVVKERDLKEIIDTTIFCAAVDETKPILKGCLIEVKDSELIAVALDGYRLAISKTKLVAAENDIQVIIAARILGEISKILGESEEKIQINIDKNKVKFIVGNTIIIAKQLEGNFIPYQNIIPTESKARVVVSKVALEKGLSRAHYIARNRNNNYVKLEIDESNIKIKSEAELNSIDETIPCKLEGEGIVIAFNSKYLLDALGKVKEEFINILITGSNAPAIIVPPEGDAYKFIVLPVRLIL
jgi:DNA polymerase-3 subunit beta